MRNVNEKNFFEDKENNRWQWEKTLIFFDAIMQSCFPEESFFLFFKLYDKLFKHTYGMSTYISNDIKQDEILISNAGYDIQEYSFLFTFPSHLIIESI